MDWMTYGQSALGGALIGLAAAGLLIANGRTAGVSGIVGGLLHPFSARHGSDAFERLAFVGGLLLGPFVFVLAFDAWPPVDITQSAALLVAGGLLVGFGTRLGGGCTSGHGVCGLARFSRRSLAAVVVFFAVAIVTVFVMEHVA